MMLLPVLLVVTLTCSPSRSQFNYDRSPDRIVYSTNGRIRGFSVTENSDVILGTLLVVHNSLGTEGYCSRELYTESVDYVEAFLYSIDLINNDPTLLPNTTLGYDVRDTCVTVDIGLEEVIDLVLGDTARSEECDVLNYDPHHAFPVSAIIGAQVSFVSVPVASFLSLANTAQISYLSTSVLLNDRTRYPYFYRTVPSDDQQSQVLIDIAVYFKWTFVSAVYSRDLYGEPGMERFRELAAHYGICIGVDRAIDIALTDAEYGDIIDELLNSTADVIVLFASLKPSVRLFSIMRERNMSRRFTWLTSDAITLSMTVFPEYNDVISSTVGVALFTNNNDTIGFIDYYSNITLTSNKQNPWFQEYYELLYNCANRTDCAKYANLSIPASPAYTYDANTPLVIDSVFTYAHALNAFIADNCDTPIYWNSETHLCNGQKNDLNGETLGPYIADVNFISPTGNHIVFKDTGSTDGRYVVYNYQLLNETGSDEVYKFVDIAIWDGSVEPGKKQLMVNENKLFQFGAYKNRTIVNSVSSQCDPCPIGHVAIASDDSCCGMCSPCLGNAYTTLSNATECLSCPQDQWGNDPLNGSSHCVRVDSIYTHASDAVGVIGILIACVLLVAIIAGVSILIYGWKTKLAKGLRRDLVIVMATGMSLAVLFTAFFVAKPSVGVCLFQRIGGQVYFVILFSLLVILQANFVWDYAIKRGYAKRAFISILYQLIVLVSLVLFQCLLTIISLAVVHPSEDKTVIHATDSDPNSYPTIYLTCVPPHIATDIIETIFQAVLLATYIVLSTISLRDPERRTEARAAVLTGLWISVIWISFVIAYFVVSEDTKPDVVLLSMLVHAIVIPVCSLTPRLIITYRQIGTDSKERKIEYSIRSVNSDPGSRRDNNNSNKTTHM